MCHFFILFVSCPREVAWHCQLSALSKKTQMKQNTDWTNCGSNWMNASREQRRHNGELFKLSQSSHSIETNHAFSQVSEHCAPTVKSTFTFKIDCSEPHKTLCLTVCEHGESLSMNYWRVKMHCDIDWHDDLLCWDTLWQQCNTKNCHANFRWVFFHFKMRAHPEVLGCADHASFCVWFCWLLWVLEQQKQQKQQRKHPIWSHGFSKSKISFLDKS